jgi:hypothetical protein
MQIQYLKRVGDVIGRYRITDYVGRGYESDVYRVKDMEFGTERSLKLLRGRGTTVLAEAESAAEFYRRLSRCAHVKRYRHMGTLKAQSGVGMRPYLVFDYVHGVTVEQHLSTAARLAPGFLLAAICKATARIHRTGLAVGDFHRGRNVLIESVTGRAIFCDLDWGMPGMPNTNQEDDLIELRKLGRWIFKSAGVAPRHEVLSILQNASTVAEASRLMTISRRRRTAE